MFHSTTKNTIQGFTLLEMLTVIAIIGILSSIVYGNMSGARVTARDSERVTEIGQIALAMELFYNACRTYPATPLVTTDNGGGACPGSITLASFMSSVPTDPTSGAYTYARTNTSFVVRATLEQNSSALNNDIDGLLAGGLGIDCGTAAGEAANGPYHYCKGS